MSMFDVSPSFVNRNKATSSRLQSGGVYVGIVTRTAANSVYVQVPKVSGDVEYGPCIYSGVQPSVGERMLVSFLDNQLSQLICFGTLTKNAAPLSSPALTGVPTAPTATVGTDTTQIATTEFVQDAIDKLIGLAPSTLDTLSEIADALGDDANFVTSITSSIATKAPLVKTITAKPSSFTLSTADVQLILECDSTSTIEVTIPTNASQAISIGAEIHIIRRNASGGVTIKPSAGVTLNGLTGTPTGDKTLRAQYSMVTLIKRAANEWYIVGDYT